MNAVEALLNAGNRFLEQKSLYRRSRSSETISLWLGVESRDIAGFSEETMDQSFRFTVFACDTNELTDSTGLFKPARGDIVEHGGNRYRVVEADGVTWRKRFAPFDSRIIFFAEGEK